MTMNEINFNDVKIGDLIYVIDYDKCYMLAVFDKRKWQIGCIQSDYACEEQVWGKHYFNSFNISKNDSYKTLLLMRL